MARRVLEGWNRRKISVASARRSSGEGSSAGRLQHRSKAGSQNACGGAWAQLKRTPAAPSAIGPSGMREHLGQIVRTVARAARSDPRRAATPAGATSSPSRGTRPVRCRASSPRRGDHERLVAVGLPQCAQPAWRVEHRGARVPVQQVGPPRIPNGSTIRDSSSGRTPGQSDVVDEALAVERA